MVNYHLGIDIGGSEIKYALSDSKLDLLLSQSIPTPTSGLIPFKEALHSLIHEIIKSYSITSIGIATPGTIDQKTGKLFGVNPNLPFWTDRDPAAITPRELMIPTFADNDANLMTLAESDNYPDAKVVLGLTIGTGIGSGLTLDGRVYHGGSGAAMELGHTCVVAEGEPCNCGLQGCVEAYSSLTGIRKRAAKHIPAAISHSLKEILDVSGKDPRTRQVIQEGSLYLSRAIANAIILLDPDVVVIGGGCIDGGLYEISALESSIKSLLPVQNQNTLIRKAVYGNQAGVRGALILAIRSLL